MSAIQYSTNSYGEFIAHPVYTAQNLAGVITVQKASNSYRGFEGFGVAITGSSCYNLMQMEPQARRAFLESIYGKNGLGLTTARLTIGASDYSAEVYTYDDVPGDVALEHFSIDRDRAYIIPALREVLEVAPELQLFASPWSPPGWMKTGGSIGGGFMRWEYVDCYADYFVKFLQAYKAEGIHIQAVTVQNEIQADQKGQMPACIWHPDLEAEFVPVLRQKLDAAGLSTEIWFHDHNFKLCQRVQWMLENHPKLAKDADGIAFHYYSGAIEDTRPLREKYQLALHFTEAGPRLYDHYDNDWCKWGIMTAKTLAEGYRSFCGWNLMLDETGGPNVGPFFCGGLVTRNSQSGQLSFSGQYKALRHIAPYVNRESKVYPLAFSHGFQGMGAFPKQIPAPQGVAVENEGQMVLLLVNSHSEKAQLQYRHGETLYYIEMMPDTVATVIVEE